MTPGVVSGDRLRSGRVGRGLASLRSLRRLHCLGSACYRNKCQDPNGWPSKQYRNPADSAHDADHTDHTDLFFGPNDLQLVESRKKVQRLPAATLGCLHCWDVEAWQEAQLINIDSVESTACLCVCVCRMFRCLNSIMLQLSVIFLSCPPLSSTIWLQLYLDRRPATRKQVAHTLRPLPLHRSSTSQSQSLRQNVNTCQCRNLWLHSTSLKTLSAGRLFRQLVRWS